MPRARRRCGHTGCDELAPCPTHTPPPWATSTRRATLPPDWHTIRADVLTRDPTCQLHYPGTWHTTRGLASCGGTSSEVDHIGRADDHTPGNLRGVCTDCHRRRTQAQSADARRRTDTRRR